MLYPLNGKTLQKPRHSSCTATNITVEESTVGQRVLKTTKSGLERYGIFQMDSMAQHLEMLSL